MTRTDVLIAGGGLCGLAAAALCAKAGLRVLLCERAHRFGGRAITKNEEGFLFNLGPHALYPSFGREVLDELGVPVHGAKPPGRGSLALDRGKVRTLPVGAGS